MHIENQKSNTFMQRRKADLKGVIYILVYKHCNHSFIFDSKARLYAVEVIQ